GCRLGRRLVALGLLALPTSPQQHLEVFQRVGDQFGPRDRAWVTLELTQERSLPLITGLESFGDPDEAFQRGIVTEPGSHLVLEGDHRQIGRFGYQSEVFADEV